MKINASDLDFLDSVGSSRNGFDTDDEIKKILKKWGNYFVTLAKKNLVAGLKKNNPSSNPETGELYASISPVIEVDGQSFRFAIQMLDYYKNVEDGRKAGLTPPPIKPIIEWLQSKPAVSSKFGLKRSTLKTAKVKNFQGLSVKPQVLSAAFAISRSIGANGIQPTGFLAKTITDNAVAEFRKDITKALNKKVTISIIR